MTAFERVDPFDDPFDPFKTPSSILFCNRCGRCPPPNDVFKGLAEDDLGSQIGGLGRRTFEALEKAYQAVHLRLG